MLIDDLDSAATDERFNLFNECDVCGDRDAAGFDIDGELVRLFEAKHKLSSPRSRGEDGLQLGKQIDVRAMQRDEDTESFGELDLRAQ
jgi:hypothetical protein